MIESRMVPSAPLAGSTMAIKQVIIVRRGCDDRYRSLQATFGVEPIGARIVWDRRQEDRRVRAHALGADRRRADRRGAEPSSWSALDFLVAQAAQKPVAHLSVNPVDGDVLRLAGRIPVDVWYTENHLAFTAVRRARVHPTMS